MTPKILKKDLGLHLFADDTSLLFLTGKIIKQIQTLHNLELKGVTDWLMASKLRNWIAVSTCKNSLGNIE